MDDVAMYVKVACATICMGAVCFVFGYTAVHLMFRRRF